MAAHKHIDRVCAGGLIFALLLSLLFVNSAALGVQAASRVLGYETRLFDTARVHTIDIVMDDWEGFLDGCEDEEYVSCAVVIDNEAYKNVGLRAKGNTSLSSAAQMGSDRYSFKIEFDHYDSGKSYHGLDKLCLNNAIQDNTFMKDYLTYRLMAAFGVNAPLCSFAYITVNGEDWGLYLAVEGLEDSFLQRSYGSDHGALYKPDSTGFGGGRGNGRDFDMDDFDPTEFTGRNSGGQTENRGGGFGGMGGMGSSDVKLQYVDDDPDSYANIFDNAKTDVSDADQARLIASLKALSEGGGVSQVVDVDQVLRYFVVHNFVVNGDSYTGSMVHNYYLYEADGRLAMLPWDYNLAFGTFQGGSADSAVNDPIDTPLSVTGDGTRPMIDWIFSGEEYMALYHQYFEEFLASVDPDVIIREAHDLIAPYVEKDPTRFCTAEDFETGVEALRTFCTLRAESAAGQLAGEIPSTDAGQAADGSALIDASGLTLSDMGSMGGGFRGMDSMQAAGGGAAVVAFGQGGPGREGDGAPNRGMPDGGLWPQGAPAENVQRPGGGAGDDGAPELPDGEAGQFGGLSQPPGGMDGAQMGGFGGSRPQASQPAQENGAAAPILLGASAAVLALGLVIAFRFQPRGCTRRKKAKKQAQVPAGRR